MVSAHLSNRETLVMSWAGTDRISLRSATSARDWLIILARVLGQMPILALVLWQLYIGFAGLCAWLFIQEDIAPYLPLASISSIGNGLSAWLHWWVAMRGRYRSRLPGPRNPDGDQGHVKQLLRWTVTTALLNAIIGFAMQVMLTDSSLAALDAVIAAMALGGYAVAALPHLATSLMMRVQLEALILHLNGKVADMTPQNCRELVRELEAHVDRIRSEWKTFLVFHFVFGSTSVVANLLFQYLSLSKQIPSGADNAASFQIINHPLLSFAFLILQVLAIGDYNEEVLRLRATTDSDSAYRVLGQHRDKLLISVCGLVVTNTKLKAAVGSYSLSVPAKLVLPRLMGWIG